MQDTSHESGASRRDFLKKAGAVAWVVPTMQVVNMASAAAQTHGSVVTTTRPPSSTTSTTTTTTTTTTTKPPECIEWRYCRIKANWTGNGWSWDTGVGAQDCVVGDYEPCDTAGIEISGDARAAKVTVPEGCEIVNAAHKAGTNCLPAQFDGRTAYFTANPQDISHVELVMKCCKDWG